MSSANNEKQGLSLFFRYYDESDGTRTREGASVVRMSGEHSNSERSSATGRGARETSAGTAGVSPMSSANNENEWVLPARFSYLSLASSTSSSTVGYSPPTQARPSSMTAAAFRPSEVNPMVSKGFPASASNR